MEYNDATMYIIIFFAIGLVFGYGIGVTCGQYEVKEQLCIATYTNYIDVLECKEKTITNVLSNMQRIIRK